MLDDLLDRFDRSRRHGTHRSGHRKDDGLRGLLVRFLGDKDDRDRRDAPHRRYERDDDHRSYRASSEHRRPWRDDDDDFDDDHHRGRRRSRFDFD